MNIYIFRNGWMDGFDEKMYALMKKLINECVD